MIDLQPEYLKIIKEILAQHVPNCEVRAYGSRITGKAHKYSDLDLVIIGKQRLKSETISALKEAFAISDLPIIIDVHDWHAIPTSFREIIEAKYEKFNF